MTSLRIAVVDDEPLARQRVRQLLAGVKDLEVAAECASGDELAAALAATRVDVLLLDVRMPGRDVFDVLAEQARAAPHTMPTIIFTTAYERYAVRAFELNAADYARIYSGGKSYLVARSMTDLEQRLDSERFVRIHRSAIVNADRIREVRPEGSRRHSVVLADGTRLVLSRSRADQLKRWLV
jgi:DNA-binding LytR/AlgR family response regulator